MLVERAEVWRQDDESEFLHNRMKSSVGVDCRIMLICRAYPTKTSRHDTVVSTEKLICLVYQIIQWWISYHTIRCSSPFNSILDPPSALHEIFITLHSSEYVQLAPHTHSTCNKSIFPLHFSIFLVSSGERKNVFTWKRKAPRLPRERSWIIHKYQRKMEKAERQTWWFIRHLTSSNQFPFKSEKLFSIFRWCRWVTWNKNVPIGKSFAFACQVFPKLSRQSARRNPFSLLIKCSKWTVKSFQVDGLFVQTHNSIIVCHSTFSLKKTFLNFPTNTISLFHRTPSEFILRGKCVHHHKCASRKNIHSNEGGVFLWCDGVRRTNLF